MGRLVLVYHDTVYREAYRALALIVARLSEHGLRVAAVPLTQLSLLKRGDKVFALLLTSGSHYRSVEEAASRASAKLLGRIPDRLTMLAARKALENAESCSSVCVHAHARLDSLVKGLQPCRDGEADCCLVLTALPSPPPPGCRRVILNGVAVAVLEELVAHVLGLARSQGLARSHDSARGPDKLLDVG